MIECFFAEFGHVATIPLEGRKTITADWYVSYCLPKVFQAWCKRRPRTVSVVYCSIMTMPARTQQL